MLTKENISDHPAKQFHTVATAFELLLLLDLSSPLQVSKILLYLSKSLLYISIKAAFQFVFYSPTCFNNTSVK